MKDDWNMKISAVLGKNYFYIYSSFARILRLRKIELKEDISMVIDVHAKPIDLHLNFHHIHILTKIVFTLGSFIIIFFVVKLKGFFFCFYPLVVL